MREGPTPTAAMAFADVVGTGVPAIRLPAEHGRQHRGGQWGKCVGAVLAEAGESSERVHRVRLADERLGVGCTAP